MQHSTQKSLPPEKTGEAIPLLEFESVSKRFPGVLALDQVDFEIVPGEVHILFGENGAGKSTLISIMAGVHQPTSGVIKKSGSPITLNSVHHARSLGISAVFQEFSLVDQLTVEQNLFLGAEHQQSLFLNKSTQRSEAKRILSELGFSLNPKQKVSFLSRAEQQMVEIAKAFRSKLSVLILDEPTASLTDKETNQLFSLIEQVKRNGVGVVYITHRMAEIKKIGDRITVLRDGKYIKTVKAKTTSEKELVELMTGRVIDQVYPKIKFNPQQTLLNVKNITTTNHRVSDLSFYVRKGEVVGFAGLVGSGKSAALRACFGIEKIQSGDIYFNDENVTGHSVRQMLDKGFFYNVPDRHKEGLVMIRNCRENIVLPSLDQNENLNLGVLINKTKEKRTVISLAEKFELHPMKVNRQVEHFSGGNQQKVLLAKCLTRDVKLYVFDEPTVGVDVGTRVEIYKFIANLCEQGAAVVIVSSDLAEIIHLTNRVYVMHRGKLQGEFKDDEINENTILSQFFDREAA